MKTVLFYCPQMETLARKIAAQKPDQIELGAVRWDEFEDGFPNFFIVDVAHTVKNRDVAFLASFAQTEDVFKQLAVIYAFPRYLARSFKLVLPYFPTGTKEREDELGDIVTAKTLARMLSVIPLSQMGPAQIVIYDIHALGERHYFSDTVAPRFESAIPLIRGRLEALPNTSNIAIAFPDEGSWKRFGRKFPEFSHIVCHKVRDGDKRIVTIKEGDPRHWDVVIVDDLVKTGNTLIECGAVLRARGAKTVSVFVTHGVLPRDAWVQFMRGSGGFACFWMTDSCPNSAERVRDAAPFEVLSLAASIAEVITD